ncbi:MAG TPA: ABC-2 transporter permease [Candidatus Krumholzibacteria bacterium]
MLPRRLYHLARADFLERVRRHGFLIALLACVYGGYAFLPPNGSKYVTLVMDGHRGIYNSAWIGTAVAMLSAAFISLIGFFIVKNAMERDRRTGVGQILATTPISRLQYTLGKTLSNFTVLACMTLIVALACMAMQFLRAEDRSFNVWQIVAPFVLITLPPLFMTAAIAVFFETMPVLRGGVGNIAFVFVWGGILGANFGQSMATPHNDPLGSGIALPNMMNACQATFPDFVPAKEEVSMGINVTTEAQHLTTFVWDGIDWTMQHVLWRLSWVLAALGIGALAAVPFDRFDPAQKLITPRKGRRAARTLSGEQSAAEHGAAASTGEYREDAEERGVRGASPATEGARGAVLGAQPRSRPPAPAADEHQDAVAAVRLTPLATTAHHARFLPMLWAEWKLIIRGRRWWWFGPLGLTIAALTAPLGGVRAIVLPLSWFWPVLLWSKLGTREATYNTEQIFFSSPRPLSRQLVATWVSGVMLSVLTGFAVAIRFAVAGDAHALAAWCAGALFIPALALALGVWTRSGKAFEAIYTCLCYAVIQSAAPLDFMGAVAAAPRHNPFLFATLTVILLIAALAGRRRRLQN